MPSDASSRLFPALLKFWRGRRGLSQLDLSIAAEVSARHISFLETARARPSEEMVLRLASALEVPLRDQNRLLRAAGFEDVFDEVPLEEALTPPIEQALSRMMEHHEPYPMVVMDRLFNLLRMNHGATRVLTRFVADPAALAGPTNVVEAIFDPRLFRDAVCDWERVARDLLARMHRESLHRPQDEELGALVDRLLACPDVEASWRTPDFTRAPQPVFSVRLKKGDLDLAFLTTLTTFSAPQNVTLEELRIESYFPLDEATAEACRAL